MTIFLVFLKITALLLLGENRTEINCGTLLSATHAKSKKLINMKTVPACPIYEIIIKLD